MNWGVVRELARKLRTEAGESPAKRSAVHGAILGPDFGLQSVLFHAVLVIMVPLMAVRNFQHTSRTSNVGVLSTILF